MNKNIISIDAYDITAKLDAGVCPLNWLAEYYHEFSGKLVMLDNNLLSYLLNQSGCDEISATKFDGFKQSFTITWKATEEYPETVVLISSYGRDEISRVNDEYVVDSKRNYNVIEELKADDILVNGEPYAKNMRTDRQVIMLTADEKINTREL